MELNLRTFLNTDLPLLVELWRSQARLPRVAQRISQATIENRVLSKPYFDAQGLWLSFAEDRPLGFAHAGFAPTADGAQLDLSQGVITLAVNSDGTAEKVAADLLVACCDYLRDKGAAVCHLGSRFPDSPFYLGMYGGCLVPGVLAEDTAFLSAASRTGFTAGPPIVILQRSLQNFRPQIDRRQMAVRRQYELVQDTDPLMATWWDACQLLHDQVMRFALVDLRTGAEAASAMFWDMQPLAASWGVAVMGLYDFRVNEAQRREGLGTFLVCESMREIAKQGYSHIEIQIHSSDLRGLQMANKLGFETVGHAQSMSLK